MSPRAFGCVTRVSQVGTKEGREAPDTGSGLHRRSASGRLGAPRRFACRPSGRGRRAQLPENQRPAAARLSSGRAPPPPEPRPVFQKLGGSRFGSYKSPQARWCLAALLARIYIPKLLQICPAVRDRTGRLRLSGDKGVRGRSQSRASSFTPVPLPARFPLPLREFCRLPPGLAGPSGNLSYFQRVFLGSVGSPQRHFDFLFSALAVPYLTC